MGFSNESVVVASASTWIRYPFPRRLGHRLIAVHSSNVNADLSLRCLSVHG